MQVNIPKGKYVIAVSGGVDSMVLLDLLSRQPELELVVAHFDHGIRPDSRQDENLVRRAANRYNLAFESAAGNLSKNASEETARNARYFFLEEVLAKHNAQAIITAHHQDDLIETAFINILRGTGRLGLTSISANKNILRPLLATPKADIQSYAKRNNLMWHEDQTNKDTLHLRNYLRLKVLTRLTVFQRKNLISNLEKVAITNNKITNELATLSQTKDNTSIDRAFFSSLPSNIGDELIAQRLRDNNIVDFDSSTINRLSLAIKASKPNSIHSIKKTAHLEVGAETAKLVTP